VFAQTATLIGMPPTTEAPRSLAGLSPKTEADYSKVLLRAYGKLGPVPALLPDLSAWPESSLKILRAAIRSYWTRQRKPEIGAETAAQIPIKFSVKRKVQYPTEKEMLAFEAATAQLRTRFRPLMMALVRMGLRAEELLKLTRPQLERALETGELFFVRKGGEEGSLPINKTRQIIEDLLAADAAKPHTAKDRANLPSSIPPWQEVGEILGSEFGKKKDKPTGTRYNLLLRLVKKTAKLAGLDPRKWTPHKLRHGFATRMNRDGAPAATIQRALAHKNLLTTQKYIHADVSDVEQFMRG